MKFFELITGVRKSGAHFRQSGFRMHAFARMITISQVFALCMLQSLGGDDRSDKPVEWESLREASRGDWLVTYSFMQGRDERIEGRPDLQRHERKVTMDHTGLVKVVKPSPGGFERERQVAVRDRDMVLRNVLELIEGYTLEFDQQDDVRTGRTLVFRAGNKSVTIELTRAAMNEGTKFLYSIGAK